VYIKTSPIFHRATRRGGQNPERKGTKSKEESKEKRGKERGG